MGAAAVGSSPWGVAMNPNTNRIYVANAGSNNVPVIEDPSCRRHSATAGCLRFGGTLRRSGWTGGGAGRPHGRRLVRQEAVGDVGVLGAPAPGVRVSTSLTFLEGGLGHPVPRPGDNTRWLPSRRAHQEAGLSPASDVSSAWGRRPAVSLTASQCPFLSPNLFASSCYGALVTAFSALTCPWP